MSVLDYFGRYSPFYRGGRKGKYTLLLLSRREGMKGTQRGGLKKRGSVGLIGPPLPSFLGGLLLLPQASCVLFFLMQA
jgi:hypothetical protein